MPALLSRVPLAWKQFGLAELLALSLAVCVIWGLAAGLGVTSAWQGVVATAVLSLWAGWAAGCGLRHMRHKRLLAGLFCANALIFGVALLLPSAKVWTASLSGWQAAYIVMARTITEVPSELESLRWYLVGLPVSGANVVLFLSPLGPTRRRRVRGVALAAAVLGALVAWTWIGEPWEVGYYVWLFCVTVQAALWTLAVFDF